MRPVVLLTVVVGGLWLGAARAETERGSGMDMAPERQGVAGSGNAASIPLISLATKSAPRSVSAPSVRVEKALRIAAVTYGVPYRELRAVAWCESQFDPNARNRSSGAAGLYQFLRGTWLSTPYRRFSVFDPEANALAAAWLVRQDGSWRQWVCSP